MNLTNMAMTAEEAKEYSGECMPANPGESDGPKYPWGLCIDLNTETLKKLGITELPKAGAVLMIAAHVKVSRTSTSEEADGDQRSDMTLQITEMALSAPVEGDAASKLWPEG